MNSDSLSLLSRTRQLLAATNLTHRQIADGANVNRHWLDKFKQHITSDDSGKADKADGAAVGKVQRVHDFLVAYESIRASQQSPPNGHPNHSQHLGERGNG